jgi:hypothetical protein
VRFLGTRFCGFSVAVLRRGVVSSVDVGVTIVNFANSTILLFVLFKSQTLSTNVINIDGTTLADVRNTFISQKVERSLQFEFSQMNDSQLTVAFAYIGSLYLMKNR